MSRKQLSSSPSGGSSGSKGRDNSRPFRDEDAHSSTSTPTTTSQDSGTAQSSSTFAKMTHSQAAKLVEEMMIKQMEIAQETAQKMQAMSASVDNIAESLALTSQQEAISKTFAGMVHSLLDRLTKQEMEIEEQAREGDRLQGYLQRTADALEFKTLQVKVLEEKSQVQKEKLARLGKERKISSKSKSSSTGPSETGTEKGGGEERNRKLNSRLKQKSEEVRALRSKLDDSQFLLQAYKERCEKIEGKGSRKSILNTLRTSRTELQSVPSRLRRMSMPAISNVSAMMQKQKPEKNEPPLPRCDESVDMSLYCK